MTGPQRRIDHLVHAVHDLDAAGDFYRRLGFRVGARNRHPWGTENRLIQFRTSFLELITLGRDHAIIPPHEPGRFSFGSFIRDYLREREGVAMLALDSPEARADAARFAEAGIGAFAPFHFERKGRRPDGGETQVAFTLAFARDPGLPSAAFFVCQQHFPENFWDPAFQTHPNGATDIRAVTIASPEPEARSAFLSAFAGTRAGPFGTGVAVPLRNAARLIATAEGDGGGIVAFAVTLPDPARLAAELRTAATAHDIVDAGIVLRAPDAHGVDILLGPADG